jgi:hypothetical protein
MRSSLALLLAALVLTTGCTASTTDEEPDLSGEQEAVANVIDDLEEAATEDGGSRRVCQALLAPQLVQSLGDQRCEEAVSQAFDDADTSALTVRAVEVTGSRATARVVSGSTGDEDEETEKRETRTFQFVRQQNAWRITSLG